MIKSYIKNHNNIMAMISEHLLPSIEESIRFLNEAIKNKKRIYFIGNGGSAADCQHLAAEFAGRYNSTKALPAIALTTDGSVLTAIANDFSFADVFTVQLEAFVQPGDIVFALSTSGNSKNVVNGVVQAMQLGAITIGLTGAEGGDLRELCTISINVPSDKTSHIQEAHMMIGHILYESVCERLSYDQ